MTRQQAIATGAAKYEGKPCKSCGNTVRRINGGGCVLCGSDNQARRYREGREALRLLAEIVRAEGEARERAVERARRLVTADIVRTD